MNLLNKLLGRSSKDVVSWVEVNELAGLLQSEVAPLVIDVRGPDEFVGPLGHIDCAQNIPLDELQGRTEELVNDRRPLILVCHTDRRSAAAADYLRRAGRAEIGVLRGGMVAWRALP